MVKRYGKISLRMIKITLSVLALTVMCRPAFGESRILRSIAEINSVFENDISSRTRYPFSITGLVHHATESGNILVDDATSRFYVSTELLTHPPSPGDIVSIQGSVTCGHFSPLGIITNAVITGKAPLPAPRRMRIGDIDINRDDLTPIITEGTVIEAFCDEQDLGCDFLILKDGNSTLPVDLKSRKSDDVRKYSYARVRVKGLYQRSIRGVRRYSGPHMSAINIEIIDPAPKDPFAVASLEKGRHLSPSTVSSLDRRKISGEVLAVWNTSRLIVREADRRLVNVALQKGLPPPKCGTLVEAVGYPSTDLFRINLTSARWRPHASATAGQTLADEPRDIRAMDILQGDERHRIVNSSYLGELIRIRGILCSLPATEGTKKRLYLDSDGFKVAVDVSSCPNAADSIEIGSTVDVTGRCLIETSDWSSSDIFPQATGFAVIARSADDFSIVSRPPWWTPARLLAAVLALLGALGAIVLWNLSLQRLVKRRARQLAKAEIAHASADLRVGERTRLAVELHDSLSQTLTGVAMEIRSAEKTPEDAPERRRAHLALAAKTIDACRQELRQCLWDLRNNTLEASDMNEAIRQTLSPHIGETELTVRFNVPRSDISDNTAHTILRIVRELATNAVRHGQATELYIAGAVENDRLLFSVRDNGCGFDPEHVAGTQQGHFGLQGIRERINTFGGEFSLKSVLGAGTKATIILSAPHSDNNLL